MDRNEPATHIAGLRADRLLAAGGVALTWLFLGAILSQAISLLLGAPVC